MVEMLEAAHAAHLLHMDGHLVLVEETKSVSPAQKEISTFAEAGVAVKWISASQVRDRAPQITADLQGALQFSGTGHVDDPHEVCKSLFDGFLAEGGKFMQAEVSRIECRGAGIVALAHGTICNAGNLVLSCGAWSKPLAAQLGYAVPLDTERGYHITLPDVSPAFKIPIASYERKVIMTPMSCGLRMTGTVELGGLKLPPDPNRYALLKRHMNELVAGVPTEGASTWMGFRPSLPDHLPVLGRLPDGRNIFFAFGHQHLGLTLAGVSARIIAAQIQGRDPGIDLSPFSPDRF